VYPVPPTVVGIAVTTLLPQKERETRHSAEQTTAHWGQGMQTGFTGKLVKKDNCYAEDDNRDC